MGRMSITERTEDYVVIETTYEYDAKTGYLLKQKEMEPEGKMVRTYSYDENGFVTKMQEVGEYTEMDAEQSMKINRTSLYTYLSIDAHGNWTKRQVESEGAMITEVRTIQYYQNSPINLVLEYSIKEFVSDKPENADSSLVELSAFKIKNK